MGMFSFQLRRSPYMLLFTDLSTYIFKSHIFDDNQHYFCIQVICKKDQKQRTNACFSFKNQVTPPNKNTTFRSFFLFGRYCGSETRQSGSSDERLTNMYAGAILVAGARRKGTHLKNGNYHPAYLHH